MQMYLYNPPQNGLGDLATGIAGAVLGSFFPGVGGAGGASSGSTSPSPSTNVSPTIATAVNVSPAIQTQINPNISPIFQQQYQPSNSGMTAGTQQIQPTDFSAPTTNPNTITQIPTSSAGGGAPAYAYPSPAQYAVPTYSAVPNLAPATSLPMQASVPGVSYGTSGALPAGYDAYGNPVYATSPGYSVNAPQSSTDTLTQYLPWILGGIFIVALARGRRKKR
jgi:hypothetical protein